MKKIQFITSYPLNGEPVIKNRFSPFISSAVTRGFEVCLISTDNEKFNLDELEFDHFCSPDLERKPKSFLGRFFFEYKQSARLLALANSLDADVKFVSVPSLMLLFNVRKLKKGILVVDLRDLVWEYLPKNGLIFPLVRFVFRYLAKRNLAKASFITVTNDSEYEYIRSFIPDFDNVLYVPNGVSKEQFNKLSKVSFSSSNTQKPIVGYIGNVGIAQDLNCLVDVAAMMPEVEFYIVGEGTKYEDLKAYINQKSINNVKMFGRIGWDKVLEVYGDVNILYAQLTPEFSTAMPSKLYEYLCTGKFIVYGGMAQAEKVLKLFSNNVVVPPSDRELLKSALQHTIDNKLYLVNSSNNRKIIAENFIREDTVGKVFDHFERK